MTVLPLGKTDLKVSAVALGCMSLGTEKQAASTATVARAGELGVTFLDTADVYGRGDAETALGIALKDAGISRGDVVIASKCGIVFPGMVSSYTHKAYDLSTAYLKRSCEESLKRIQTDYLDLYQPHRIDYLTHPEETARALEDLKQEGKIRHAGVSNYTADEIRALSAFGRLESLQTQFSLLHLEPLETGLTAVCQEKGMTVLCWSPNHRGILAGAKPPVHDDWLAQREEGVLAQVEKMAGDYGVTSSQLALAWLMHLPNVIPLVGTANPDHLAEAAGAADITIERDDWYELMVMGRGRPMPWGQRPYVYTKER